MCISINKCSVIPNRAELSAGSPLRPSPRHHSSQAPCFLMPAPSLICTTLKAAGGSGSSPRREAFLNRPCLHLWTASATFPSLAGSEGLLPSNQPCSRALRTLQDRAAGGERPGCHSPAEACLLYSQCLWLIHQDFLGRVPGAEHTSRMPADRWPSRASFFLVLAGLKG